MALFDCVKAEWDRLGDWICGHRLHSPQIKWLIQIPRIFHIWKRAKMCSNFGEMMANIFEPLFEVTIDPQSHPSLHLFLETVVGFDSVDDESQPESMEKAQHPSPSNYDAEVNPPYIYWMYYLWVNINKLNRLRERRGLNTFSLCLFSLFTEALKC